MIRRILAVLVFLALAALARPALAQTYSMSYSLEPNAWLGAVGLSWTANGNPYSINGVAMGPQIITFNGIPPPNYAKSNVAYCVDLYHWDQSPSTVFVDPITSLSNIVDDNAALDGLTQAEYNANLDKAAWLYTAYNPFVQAATGQQEQIDGAALQLAIWDVMAGPTFQVTNQNGGEAAEFSAAQTLAGTWFNSVGTNTGNGTLYQIDRNLQPTAGQDLIGPAAPEGSSLVLFAFALAPLALIAARKRRLAAERTKG